MVKLFDTTYYCKENEKQGVIPGFFKISKDIIKIVWASMLESFLVALVTIFDGIQVSILGNVANTAITICRQPYFLLIAFSNSLNIVLSTIIARRKGENDIEGANKTMHLGLVLSFIISIILSVLFIIISKPLCLMMKAQDDTLPLAITYFRYLVAGHIFNGLRLTINSCQKGMGKTTFSLVSSLVANIVNIFFNYVLITGKFHFPALGIKGAAIATNIGNFIAFVISFVSIILEKEHLKFSFKKLFNFSLKYFKPIKKLIVSILLEQLLIRFGFIILNIIVNKLGTIDTYINGICNDINSLLFTLSDGFAIGSSAIIGIKLGKKRKDLAIVYAKVAMIISATCGFILAISIVIFRFQIVGLYKPDSFDKINKACNILILAAIACIPQNLQWVSLGILRTAGDSKYTAFVSLSSVAIIRPLITYLLVYVFCGGLGVIGAWIGQIIDQSIRMILNLTRFNSRKWVNIKI